MMTKIEKLLTHSQHVFTVQDLAIIWNIGDKKTLWSNIRYYLRIKKLIRLHKGVYAVGPYTTLEVCQKLVAPSYISLYTALTAHGIIFQYYDTVHAMALISKKITIRNQSYEYHQFKDLIFYNPMGIIDEVTYRIASPERAVCDSLYLVPSLNFDKLDSIDPQKLKNLSRIYQNKSLEKRVINLITSYA